MSFILMHPWLLIGCISGLLSICYAQVCFEHLGCFKTSSPFDNANGKVPIQHNNTHLLFPSTSKKPESLSHLPGTVQNLTGVNFRLPLKVVVHGFNNDLPNWMYRIKDKLLSVDPDQNIYLVGWAEGAKFPDYDQAVANQRLVSTEIFLVVQQFISLGLSLDNVHLIGHSLGAHICGDIGRRFEGQVGRISGLDPASPGFDDNPAIVRLDKTDAKFIDVIHTDAKEGGSDDDPIYKSFCGGLGSFQPAGHLDVYVNEGMYQPGCYWFKKWICRFSLSVGAFDSGGYFSCSHGRAHQLFIESITTECPFHVYNCDSFSSLDKGLCLDCPKEGCNSLGFKSKPERYQGRAWVKTEKSFPFCRRHFSVALTLGNDASGTIEVGIKGPNRKTKLELVSDDDVKKGQMLTKLVLAREDRVSSVLVKYEKSWWSGPRKLQITDVTVKGTSSGQPVQSVGCGGAVNVETGTTKTVDVDDQC